MQLSPKQQFVLSKATKRINLLSGTVRSGKSYCNKQLFLQAVYETDYSKFLLTGKTRDTIKRNLIDDLTQMIGRGNYTYNFNQGELRLGEKTIYCIGAADDSSEERLRGATFGAWYADEITLHPRNFVDQAITRVSLPNSRIHWDCNPDSPFHHIYKRFIEIKREDVFHQSFGLNDNPSLSDAYKKELMTTFSGVFFRRMILGEWCLAEGLIYDMFSESMIVDKIPPIVKYWIGADYGTGSVTVFLLLGEDKDKNKYVIKEWLWDAREKHRQYTDSEFVRALLAFAKDIPIRTAYVDPSATSFIAELKQEIMKQSLSFYANEANNDVLDGIRATGNEFSCGKLFVHESCKGLIKELNSSYIWDERSQLLGIDKPLKANDHHCDALRYGIYSDKLLGFPAVSFEINSSEENDENSFKRGLRRFFSGGRRSLERDSDKNTWVRRKSLMRN